MVVKRTGIVHSFRLVRNDPIAVSTVLWTSSKDEIIWLLEAGIKATGVQINDQTIAECQAAIDATYTTEARTKKRQSAIVGGIPAVGLRTAPGAVVPIVAAAAPAAVALAVAAPAANAQSDSVVSVAPSRLTEEHQRLRSHFLSTALGGDITE